MTDTDPREIRFEEWPFRRQDWEPGPLTAHWLDGKPEDERVKLALLAARIAVNLGSTPGNELSRLRGLFDD